ncbi:hypothetical protein SVAN01_10167 [Stagonosporopsis vannaccii]|nr:hypothetical protein SVAN01_10167 [Stagonosporopsis vannaccii]
MDEQHALRLGPSPLREVQQVPENDRIVPETHSEASDRLPDENVFDDPADVAFVEHNRVKPLRDSKETSLSSPSLPHKFGLSKFFSSATLEPLLVFEFTKRSTNKPSLLKADPTAPEQTIPTKTVLPSFEIASNGDSMRDTHITTTKSPMLPSPASTDFVDKEQLRKAETTSIDYHLQKVPHSIAGSSEHQRALSFEQVSSLVSENTTDSFISAALSKSIVETQASPRTSTKLSLSAKKKDNAMRVKRGRRTLLSLPLRPWPPRNDSSPCGSRATSATSTIELGDQTEKCNTKIRGIAVINQPGAACKPVSGRCDDEQHPENTSNRRQDPSVQQQSVDTFKIQPVIIPSPAIRDIQSSCISCESRDPNSSTQQALFVARHASIGYTAEPRIAESSQGKFQASTDLCFAPSQQHPKHFGQQPDSKETRTSPSIALNPPTHPVNARDACCRASELCGAIQVTKAQKKVQAEHSIQQRLNADVASNQRSSGATALDSALEFLREACLADQCRTEDRMAAAVNKLEEDNIQFQRTIAQQSAEISELNIKLRTREVDFKRLNDKVVSAQKYVCADDVRKAEGMLRFLSERSETGFMLLARSLESKPCAFEHMQQFLQDQIQSIQADLLRQNRATVNVHLAQAMYQSLRLDLNSQTKDNQQLEEQTEILTSVQTALKTRVVELEKENEDLRSSLCGQQNASRELGLETMQLQERLLHVQNDLQVSHETVEQHERLSLEHKLEFSKYRANAIVHLRRLEERLSHTSHRAQAGKCEYPLSQQTVAVARNKLESAENNTGDLTFELTQYRSTVEALRQEHHAIMEKNIQARTLLGTAEEVNSRLEEENANLSAEIDGYCTCLQDQKGIEANLYGERDGLQQRLTELHNLIRSKREQQQQTDLGMGARLQQAQAEHTIALADLQSRLTLSENARKESQAKLRQAEEAHKHQIDCHEQKFKDKLDDLITKADREHEKVKAEYLRAMEQCKQDANAGVTKTAQETERHLESARLEPPKVLIPNTQQSSQSGDSCVRLQQPRTRSIRNKVDRHTNWAADGVSSKNLRPTYGDRQSAAARSQSTHSQRAGSETSVGYFAEEYENIYGPQASPRDQATQHSVVEPETGFVTKTQDFERSQGRIANFEMIESQLPEIEDLDQDETATELSNMPSEDLSEMLLDLQPGSDRGGPGTRRLLSSRTTMWAPDRLVLDSASDDASTNSYDRPKSRANTASRMMLPRIQDVQQQHVRADEHSTRAHNKHLSRKRNCTSSIDEDDSFKKRCAPSQSHSQRASSTSKTSTRYTPGAEVQSDVQASPSRATARRLSKMQSAIASSHIKSPQLSSIRVTRTNRYAARFGQELDTR